MPNRTTEKFDAAAYMNKYITEKITYKHINFTKGREEDEEMLAWLKEQPEGISPYIKRLIREDMDRRRAPKET